VEIVAKIESELHVKTGNLDLAMADYFDFICGTARGTIIADRRAGRSDRAF
jgi:hypothetical protein